MFDKKTYGPLAMLVLLGLPLLKTRCFYKFLTEIKPLRPRENKLLWQSTREGTLGH